MIISLSACVFLVMMGYTIVSPVLPLYALTMGASFSAVSFLVSAFALTRMCLDLPAGLLGSRFHPKDLMMAGVATVSLASVVCALAPNYWVLLVGRLLEGAGSAFYTTMSTTTLAMTAPKEARGKHLSIYTSMILFGSVSGPSIGGVTARYFGLSAPFWVYAGVTAFGILLVHVALSKSDMPRASEKVTVADLREHVKDRSAMLVNLATFSLFFLRAGVGATLVPLFAYKNLGLTEDVLGVTLTATALCTFATIVPSGTFTDRHGRRPSMMACLMLAGLTTLLIPFSWNYPSFVGFMLLYGLTLGLSGPMAAWIADLVPREKLAPAMGLFRTINDAGMVAGPAVLGSTAGITGANSTVTFVPFAVAAGYLALIGLLLAFARDPVGEGRPPSKGIGPIA